MSVSADSSRPFNFYMPDETNIKEFKPITFSDEFILKYWDGTQNRIIRYQAYLRRGLALFNEHKNYILMLFGSYWTIKTADYWLALEISDGWLVLGLGVTALIGLFGLVLLGRWHLFKAQKSEEFISTQRGSVTGYGGYNMSVRSLELLNDILEESKKRH